MNCREGDLAIVVQSELAANTGRIVRCIRFIPFVRWRDGDVTPAWETDCWSPAKNGDVHPYYADDQLRPLRDSDKEDEVLTRVGRPAVRKVPNPSGGVRQMDKTS